MDNAPKQDMTRHWRGFKIRLLLASFSLVVLIAIATTCIVLQGKVGRYFQSNRNRFFSILVVSALQVFNIIFLFFTGKVCMGAYGPNSNVTPKKPTISAILTLAFAVATWVAETVFFWVMTRNPSGLTGERNEDLDKWQFNDIEAPLVAMTWTLGAMLFPYLLFLFDMIYWGFWISKVVSGYRALDSQLLQNAEMQGVWKTDVEATGRPSSDDMSYDRVKATYQTRHGRPMNLPLALNVGTSEPQTRGSLPAPERTPPKGFKWEDES